MADLSSRSLSGTNIAGSEEYFDTICDFCNAEKQKLVKAEVFCIPCMEYLCIQCKRNHKKTSTTKHHPFQDMSQLAATFKRKKPSLRPQNAMLDRCPKHPDEQIKFFCSSHQQLACGVCVPLYHRLCDNNVSFIPDISGEVAQSVELRDTLAELKKVIATLEASQTHAKQFQQHIKETYGQLIEDIKQFKQAINQHIDKLTVELFLQASKLSAEIIQSGTNQMPTCDILLDEIKAIKCDLEKKCELKHYSQLFVVLKTTKEKIQTWESEASKISRSVKDSRLVFSRDSKLEEVTTMAKLGIVSVNEACPESAKFLLDINIKSATDKKDCDITGIAALTHWRLAATDSNNKSVKVVDTAARKVTECVSLTSAPRDITVVGVDQLAVVLHRQRHIQLLNLTPKLSLSHTLPMPGYYRSITYSEGNYILACHDPVESVDICDTSGQLLRRIKTDNSGNKLFTEVSSVAVSPDKKTIYISDFVANKLVFLNYAGVVMAIYSHDRLKGPHGVAVVDCGCLLVSSWDDSSLLQLDCEGNLVKVLLGREDGLLHPWAVAHRHNTIYISSFIPNPADRNTIRVFQAVSGLEVEPHQHRLINTSSSGHSAFSS